MENKDKLSNKNIDKKKVGIMTWFNGCNYGTILQAKALQHVICKLGNEADIINYKKRNYKNREIKKISSLFCRLKNKIFYDRINNTSKFNDFRDKYLKLTESCNTFVELNDLNSKYDVFVCGSDQIWSPFSFDEKYFLNFTTKDKKVAYAPSFGVSKISNLYVYNKIKNLLSDFKYISVREKQGQKIIKELTNQDAQLVLDPTLLLDYEDWKIYENKEILNKINDKYVLCYFLGKSNSYYKKIVNFAKKNNYQIINIPIFKRQKFNKFNISNVGPSEFLSLFKNAEYIFTDSLHGTLFSLNFRKRFFIFKRFNDKADYSENSRIYNIIELFNLHDRVIDEKDNIIEKDINYNFVSKKITKLKEDSYNYLDHAIKNVNNLSVEKLSNHLNTKICSGCGACKNICPKNAISIELDEEGFEHYKINEDKCINCGLCQKVCPMIKINSKKIENSLGLYAFKAKENNILLSSSSGGFSYVLSYYLNKNYYVCGSFYNKEKRYAEHILIKTNEKDKLYKIQGSKYIHSKTSDIFKELIELPKSSKVLFIGLPCQVAGLDKLLKLKNKRENFVLVDLVCHGVPSIHLWNNYLSSTIKKYDMNEEVIVKFRDKQYGWENKFISLSDNNKKIKKSEKNDDFYNIFKRNYIYSHACYECPYRQYSSADIKIGDFWGEKYKKDSTGVSMVIAITEKGKDLINELKEKKCAIINEESIKDYFKEQTISNVNEPIFREEMIKEIKSMKDLKEIRKKYCFYDEFVYHFVDLYKFVRRCLKK